MMTTLATESPVRTLGTAPAAALPAARRDLYAGIHKALRLFMSRTMCTVGSADPADPEEVAPALDMLRRLLGLCEVHVKDENDYMHPALERARPGTTARIAAEHEHHLQSIADLRELAALAAASPDSTRNAAWGRLYRALALFVAENLEHMHVEETSYNPVLWDGYTDDELVAIEHALVASIPPAAMFEALHWFMPALNGTERAAMLSEMRQGMPDEPFRAVLAIAERTLAARDHERLMRDLGLPVPAW